MKKILKLTFFLCLFIVKSYSQTVNVGTYVESVIRNAQLSGLGDSSLSFTQHPVSFIAKNKKDSVIAGMIASKSLLPEFKILGIPSGIRVLPFTSLSDYNSKLPYGYNNGSMYPNVGLQSLITGGIFIKAGILNVQLKPELIHASNGFFETFSNVQANYKSPLIQAFFFMINGTDAPERFAQWGISRAYPGQSKITLEYKGIEAGISTENMWWGPGVQNSIMMSNSAPGFMHWTINTVKPLNTYIGSFEWQVIGGILKQSGYTPYDPNRLVYDPGLYLPKPQVTRYLSAFTFNWHPKWVDGFFIGMSGFNYMNRTTSYFNKGFIKKYLPVFSSSSAAENNSANGASGDGQDFAYAINMRQVFAKYNAEVYFEFARNDAAAGFRDLVLEPEQASAYTIGASRIFNLSIKNKLKLRAELTHLQSPDTFLLRPEPVWYVHENSPRDGYTNDGRYIGAGIGPGGNSLMLDLSFIRNLNSYGFKFERQVHNNDLYYMAWAGTEFFSSHWIDFSSTFYANLKFKKYLITAEYTPVSVINYEYLYRNDQSNKHARLVLTYFFD